MSFEQEIEAYKNFRSTRLIPEREILLKDLKVLKGEILDFESLAERTRETEELEDDVISLQLGSGFTADFRVFEREFLLVSVGFGFFCQMRWQEAHSFALSKISFLMRKRKRIEEKLLKVEEHLKLTTEILEELAKSTTTTTTINK